MRRFEVWADCQHAQNRNRDPKNVVEMPDDATDEECDAACQDLLDTLIGNNFDTGWNELDDETKASAR